MNWYFLVCGLIVMFGAGLMFSCIIRVKDVLEILALATAPDRSWLSHHIKQQRWLMIFFLLGYVVISVIFLAGLNVSSELFVATVFFFGAVFVYIGITIQIRLSNTMLKTLQGLLPICAWCKRIRVKESEIDKKPEWESIETYLAQRTDVDFTHGICEECMSKIGVDGKPVK